MTLDTYTFQILSVPLVSDPSIQLVLDTAAVIAPVQEYVATVQLSLPEEEQAALNWTNLPIAIYLDQLIFNFWLPSLGDQTPAPETKRSSTLAARNAEMERLGSIYPKCRIVFYVRQNYYDEWIWIGQEVIQNLANRVNYVNILQPYLTQGGGGDKLSRTTQIGVQFVEDELTKTTLPQSGDMLTIKGAISVELPQLKKNDELEKYAKLILNTLTNGTMLSSINSSSTINIVEGIRGAKNPVSATITSTASIILAANSARAGYNITNNTANPIYVREGTAPTTALFDFIIPPTHMWKEDFSSSPRYLGAIHAITAAGQTATVLVSEASVI